METSHRVNLDARGGTETVAVFSAVVGRNLEGLEGGVIELAVEVLDLEPLVAAIDRLLNHEESAHIHGTATAAHAAVVFAWFLC